MRAVLDGKEYAITLEENSLAKEIAVLCPMELQMNRSGEHEYYGSLSQAVDVKQACQTSSVKAGGVYYFAAWKAFSLVFRDADIRPYSVHIVGTADESLIEALAQAGRSFNICIEP